MQLSASHKALIITILFGASVVLMTYNLHLKKQNELISETFYEVLPEEFFDDIEEEESLEEILKSFDNLSASTNQAYNEERQSDDFQDEEFKEAMERLANRNANNETYEARDDYELTSNRDGAESFSDINKLIEKTSGNSANNANSTISFSLVDRERQYIPPPIYLCENSGRIVVSIKVNAQGAVTEVSYNNASNSTNECLIDHALEYAKASRFSSSSKASQLGTITFNFQGKN